MGQAKAPGSLRSSAIINSVDKKLYNDNSRKVSALSGLAKAALISVSYAALGVLVCATPTQAQTAAATPQLRDGSQLPPIQVTEPEARHHANSAPAQRADRGGQRHRSQTARRPEQAPAPKAFGISQDAQTGTVGVYANSTSIATKTNTPLVNIPQSVTVVTKDFIRDQSFQSRHRGDALRSGRRHPSGRGQS